MSTESNKAIARRFLEEVFGQGKLAVADEIVALDHVDHGPGALPGMPPGPEGSKMLVTVYAHPGDSGRLVNGKIVESWGIFDQFGMMQQLGIIPAAG